MTHDSGRDGNVGIMVEYLKEKKEGFTFRYLKKKERNMVKDVHKLRGKLSFFIEKPYHLATSEFVMLDNIFLPMAFLKFNKRVRIIQLWHGTGTIKKFGQDVNTGFLKKLEYRANKNITHLVVNSQQTKKEYASSFGVKEDRIFIYGLPRTDFFFDQVKMEERKKVFYNQYPELKGKKLILYAPTFRDKEKDNPVVMLDTKLLSDQIPENYILMLRLHPFVEEAFEKNGHLSQVITGNVISMSAYPDINTLLLVSDYLITDYSSVIYEYCLLNRPIIFFAYDLEQFSNYGRGFYQPYLDYVPGPVTADTKEIVEIIRSDLFDYNKIDTFKNKNYRFQDGKSAERLYHNIFQGM
jgi:CDP-ribitol ribitolphosphotransferase